MDRLNKILILFYLTLVQLVLPSFCNSDYRIPKMTSERTETYMFKDKEYIIQNMPLTWEDARIICRGHYNGSLAILDTEEKASYMAEALAESRFALDSMWVGARRSAGDDPVGYRWEEGIPLRRTLSDVMKGEESYQGVGKHYPMWLNRTLVPVPEAGADCVGLGRVFHDHPVFIDLPCQLERAFVCERDSHAEPPVLQLRTVKCKTGKYHVYSGSVTWDQAAAHCVMQKMQLANIATLKCMKKLGLAMLKSRPSIENAWVGARGIHGNWTWVHTGLSIYGHTPYLDTDKSVWPPMRDPYAIKEDGCLQLDRHAAQIPMFLRSRCERKMQFICYDEKESPMGLRAQTAMLPSDDNYFYVLVREPLTWQQAYDNCKMLNATLGILDNHEIFIQLLLVMGENKENPVYHIWLSGVLTTANLTDSESISTWHNPVTGKQIVDPKNFGTMPEYYLAPWLDEEYSMENACLNLDRQNHLSGLVYGLPCNTLQQSICMIEKGRTGPTTRHNTADMQNIVEIKTTMTPILSKTTLR